MSSAAASLLLGALFALSPAVRAEDGGEEHPWKRPLTFDDGQYVNRIAVQGEADIGAGYQHDPGYAGVDEPAFAALAAVRGAYWWQTRDLDFGVLGALFPRYYLGEVLPILQHRPDSLVELGLDVRPAQRLGLLLEGRFLLDSAQLFPFERPDAWQPWGVPSWGGDLAQGAATAQLDMRPVLAFHPEPALAIELGASLEVDRYRFLEPQRTLWEAGPAVRMAGGPILGAAFDLTPDLAVLGRARTCWYDWSAGDTSLESLGVELEEGSGGGLDWQVWGGVEGFVARPVHLRVLAGYGRQLVVESTGEEPLGAGLLIAAALELGRDGPRQLAAGYRHGPRDLHSWRDDPHHYAYLRYTEAGPRWLELHLQGGYRHFAGLELDLPEGALVTHGGATLWFLDWLGLGLGGFYEHQVHLESGWPVTERELYGGQAVLKVGRVGPPEWVNPGG